MEDKDEICPMQTPKRQARCPLPKHVGEGQVGGGQHLARAWRCCWTLVQCGTGSGGCCRKGHEEVSALHQTTGCEEHANSSEKKLRKKARKRERRLIGRCLQRRVLRAG